jgi:hypothetical protein
VIVNADGRSAGIRELSAQQSAVQPSENRPYPKVKSGGRECPPYTGKVKIHILIKTKRRAPMCGRTPLNFSPDSARASLSDSGTLQLIANG